MKTYTILRVALFTAILSGYGFNQDQIHHKKKGLKVVQIIFLLLIIPLFNACNNVYISTPQPVDSKNIYSFPKEFRGMWTCEDNTIIIGKDFFKYIQYSDIRVSKQYVDTSSTYMLKDNKIYIIDTTEGKLRGGFPYKLKLDRIYYQERNVQEIALGSKSFLRKVKKNYILNVKQENEWWELALIRKDNSGNIIVGTLEKIQDLEKFTNYKKIHFFKFEHGRSDYIEATWNKKELLEMINKGLFSDTLLLLQPNNKIRCN